MGDRSHLHTGLPLIGFGIQEDQLTDDRRLVQRAGLVVPAAVWVLGLVSPPPGGLTLGYVTTYTLLLAATALVDQTSPPVASSRWRRFGWLLVEIVLCGLVVRAQGTLIRPMLIYLLPVGRAILLLGEREGSLASLLVWLAYGRNTHRARGPITLAIFRTIGPSSWPRTP